MASTPSPSAPSSTLAASGGSSSFPPRVVVERELASSDTDTATRQTVKRMCAYIRESVPDEQVRAAAEYAWLRFGGGVDSPAAKCWGVFWWLKHCVAFRLDEATMFRIGERDQQDLLISPAVLVRFKNPAEDCDGFTMLASAMLTALGVPVVIATVAANRRDPSRWSHVFPCALLPGDVVLPLDASHGSAPGWMIPPRDMFRWQAWNLDGEPVNVRPLAHDGLHSYARRGFRGLGETQTLPFPEISPAPSTGTNWTSFFQNLATQGAGIARAVLTPPAYQQTVVGPGGQTYSTTIRNATPSTALTAGTGLGLNSTTLLYVGGGLLAALLILQMSKGRG